MESPHVGFASRDELGLDDHRPTVTVPCFPPGHQGWLNWVGGHWKLDVRADRWVAGLAAGGHYRAHSQAREPRKPRPEMAWRAQARRSKAPVGPPDPQDIEGRADEVPKTNPAPGHVVPG